MASGPSIHPRSRVLATVLVAALAAGLLWWSMLRATPGSRIAAVFGPS